MGDRRRRVSDLKIEQLLRMDREYFSNETSPLQVDSILDLRDERAETKRLRERNLLMHAVVLAASVYCDPECEDDTSYVCLLNAVKEYEALDSKALDGDATANPERCDNCSEPLDAEGNCYPCFELAQEKRREEGE